MENKKKKRVLSRRDFLKGAGAATVGAAAVSVLGTGVFASDEADAISAATEEERTSRQGGASRSSGARSAASRRRVADFLGPVPS